MGKFDSSCRLQAIVVGSSADEFVRDTMSLLGDYKIEFVLCEDVYSAVGRLAKNNSDGNVLVIGRIEQLSREKGRFFHIAGENRVSCCCLVDGNLVWKRRYPGVPGLAATETGAFIINEPVEIEKVIAGLLAGGLTSSSNKFENNKAPAFIKDEFLATKAELDALLGA